MTNPTEKKIICLIVVSARGKREVDSALCTAIKPIMNIITQINRSKMSNFLKNPSFTFYLYIIIFDIFNIFF